MSITIGKYNFDGPYTSMNDLRNQSGVYVIVGRNTQDQNWVTVDVGESERVKERVENHDRADCWDRQGYSTLAAAVLYCNEQQRMRIEQELRRQYAWPCGER